VVVSNDGQQVAHPWRLEEQKLGGKVLVSGQEADLAALQRIIAGTQSMKFISRSHSSPRRAAKPPSSGRNEKVESTSAINNGRLTSLRAAGSIALTRTISLIRSSGRLPKLEDVYRNVPRISDQSEMEGSRRQFTDSFVATLVELTFLVFKSSRRPGGCCRSKPESRLPRRPGESMSVTTSPPLLEMRDITKSFPGVRAIDGVTFDLFAGEVHALVGEKRRWQVNADEVWAALSLRYL